MDNFQFWLYVIIGLIYLISRIRKKPTQQSDFPDYDPERPVVNDQHKPGTNAPSVPRQLTFEELLKQITEGKQPEKEVAPVSRQKPHYSFEEEDLEEIQDLETENVDYRKRDKVVNEYEDAKRMAFHRPSLEETMSVYSTDMTFGKFKEFEQDKSKNLMQEYLIGLDDPNGWKRAVVMSEILQRKF